MADDVEQLVLSISADVRQMQRALKRMEDDTKTSTKVVSGQFDDMSKKVVRNFTVIEGGAKRAQTAVTTSINAQRAAMQNLSFQLNDVATQLSAGASASQVFAQQGGQIVQALSGAGGVVGALRLIGAAATNPFTLATVAITTLAAVSAEFFKDSTQDAQEATKALKAHADLVEDLAKQYGGLIPELERLARLRREEADAAGLAAAKETALDEAYANTAKTTQDLHGQIIDLLSTLEAIGVPAKDLSDLQKQFDLLAKAVDEHKASASDAQPILLALNGIIDNGSGKVVKMATAIRDQLVTSFRELNDAAASAARTVDNFNAPSFLRGAGGPGDIGPMLERLRTQEIGSSRVAEFIKAQESFRSKAYFDVNAFRVGFGSDTFVDEMGKVQKVTKDTVITFDQAMSDLSRRIPEFQGTIQKQIGPDFWKSLSEEQQAALTSIAYNYGKLPDSIVKAIQDGGGAGKVAQAIAALSSNPDRRKREASLFGGSAFDSTPDKTPEDLFKGSTDQVRQRIDALNAEYEARAKLNPLISDYGYAVERAKIEQQLLNDAQKAGIAITPELKDKIGELAENTARAAAKTDELRVRQQEVARAASEMSSLAKEAVGGFIRDLIQGKSAAEAFGNALSRIGDKLLESGLNALFSPDAFGGGGLLNGIGKLLFPGVLHDGGVAGKDGYGHSRLVPSSVFAGARRRHLGLAPDEFPAILQKGETVIPRMTRRSGGGSETIRVELYDDSGRMADIADRRIKTSAGTIVDVAVRRSTDRVVPTVARFQNDRGGSDYRIG